MESYYVFVAYCFLSTNYRRLFLYNEKRDDKTDDQAVASQNLTSRSGDITN